MLTWADVQQETDMASRNFRDVQALQPEIKLILGTITTDSSGDVSSTTGSGFTAAKTATGEYTITLSNAYNTVLHGAATIVSSTASLSFFNMKSKGTSSVVFYHIKETTGTLAAANVVSLTFTFMIAAKNSSLSK